MKSFFSLFALAVLFTFSCQKELEEDLAPTQPGSLAPFQAKINGALWVANKSYSANYVPAISGMPRLLSITGTSNDKKVIQITLVDSGVHQYTLLPVTGGVNVLTFVDSSLANPLSFYSSQSFSGNAQNSVVIITAVDVVNKTISGTFAVKVYRSADRTDRTLTEGVFTKIPYTETGAPAPDLKDTLNVKVDGNSFIADIISSSSSSVTSNTIPLYLILGQSNTGWCNATAMTPQEATLYRISIPNTAIWNPGAGAYSATWQPLVVGSNTMCENFADPTQFGPEASFFVNMQNLQNRKRLVYKQGQGGTTLATEWKPQLPGLPLYTGGSRWQQFSQWLNLAVTQAAASGYKLDLKAFIWMQGEDDAYLLPDANAYLANLGNFFTQFDIMWQDYVNTYSLPNTTYKKIIGRIHAPTAYPFKDIVRKAQTDFCLNPANNAILINTDNYPLQDWVHYSATGQIQFGKDIYNSTRFEDTSAYTSKNLNIRGANNSSAKNITISFPSNITPGSYIIDNSFYKGVYSDGSATYTSVSGTLQILENNTSTRRIKGSFAFRGERSGGVAAQLSEGYFSVTYQ